MILQTGQRTDIPAFYGQWFINRVKAGFVDVRNPYHPNQIMRYMINHNIVDGIAFCTKNPLPFIQYLPYIADYHQYWHMTITPYGTDIEPYVPPYEQVINGFKTISNGLNPQSMVWRYDPILINHTYSVDFHCESFYKIAKSLEGYTDTVVASYLDIYDKVLRNFPEGKRPPKDIQIRLMKNLVDIANQFGMTLKTCGEGDTFKHIGADTSGCLTIDCYERAWNVKLKVPKKRPARPECNCYLHGDIGAYDTCSHFCRYCYANTNQHAVRININDHDPRSSLLIGHINPNDTIKISCASKYSIPVQNNLFDPEFLG